MKTVVTILGAVLVLGIVGIISLPFVVDLNKYRPQIKEEIEKKIDGEFDVESIRFRGLGIQLKNLSIRSKGAFENKNLLEVGEARVKISLGSLLTGHPKATLRLRQPNITLVKNASGGLNVTELPKKAPPEKQKEEQEAKQPKKKSKMPGLLLGAKLSLQIEQASLKYIDEKKRSTNSVENLHATLNNIAFNSPIDFSVKAFLHSSEGKKQLFQGEISLQGRAKVEVERSKKISAIELDTQFAFGELKATLAGKVTDIESLQTDLKIKTPVLSLAKIKGSFGTLSQYPLAGTMLIEGSIKGPLKKYDQCHVRGNVDIHLESGSTDLKFKSEISDTLASLNGRFTLEAPLLNLDELLPKKRTALPELNFPSLVYAAESGKKEDPLAQLRNSAMMRGLKASGKIEIQKMVLRGTEMTQLSSKLNLDNLRFSISQFTMKGFQGGLHLKGDIELDRPKPEYRLSTVVQNFNLNSLLTFASSKMKNVAEGTMLATIDLEGKGTTLLDAKQYMKGNGRVEMKEVELKGLNMGKSLQEQLRLVSIFAGSDILDDDLTGRFDSFKSSLIIQEGRLYTPDAVLSAPQYGATLKGFASFDKEIQYDGKVLLPAKKFNSEALRSLADNRGMIGFPFKLSGVLPKFSFMIDVAEMTRMVVKGTAKQKLKEKLGIDLPVDLPF